MTNDSTKKDKKNERAYLIFPKSQIIREFNGMVVIDTQMTFQELIMSLMNMVTDESHNGLMAVVKNKSEKNE